MLIQKKNRKTTLLKIKIEMETKQRFLLLEKKKKKNILDFSQGSVEVL